MFRRHEPRKNRDAAGKDHIIMVTTAIGGAANFLHGQPASRCAVFGRQLLQNQNSVRETENMTVGAGSPLSSRSSVVQLRPAKYCLKERIWRR
jgi:hypothetical protein